MDKCKRTTYGVKLLAKPLLIFYGRAVAITRNTNPKVVFNFKSSPGGSDLCKWIQEVMVLDHESRESIHYK